MADQPDPAPAAQAAEAEKRVLMQQRRRRWLTILVVVVVGVGLLATLYHFVIGVRHVSTDNAYVGADTALVTPLVAGAVESVRVANTQAVKKGDILVTIDPSDARIVAMRAEADLAAAERQYRQTSATGSALELQVAARGSDVARAQAEAEVAQAAFDKAKIDLERRQALAKEGAVSGDELTAARNAYAAAKGQMIVAQASIAQARASQGSAQQNYQANQALVSGSINDNPDVAGARARLAAAKLDLERTVIRAPFDGVIAQRSVQVGQRVAPGNAIMTVVPLTAMYVDANFKEGQLRNVKIGQPARLTSDLYGSGVVYHGKVIGLAGGTGSAFALIPAQNATGNWIKVIQRLPTRIALDPKELADHPLRVGLSMSVTIDVGG
ncbi:HlyD family efflux transporter periplasmic adaptor subunit [Sphingomonas sp. MMS24-J13]|uniref:HlyD family efflux transporter periplasmic adaptor subunit n=1 Tax=Sphingomonas sp. MMS24-J13 TaxID=3238686 RepID=UPI00384E17BE